MSSIILTLNEWRTKGHYPLFLLNKPIGASPRHDYVLTRMILLFYYILYTVWIGTSKKGGNAPRATDKKSMVFWSSAVIVWRYLQYLPNNLTWELNNSSHVDLCIFILNTEGKLGRQIRYFKIGGSPLFPKEGGGLRPPFVHFALLLRDKRNSRQIFKKWVPVKSSKGVPAKSYSQKYPQ